MKIGTENIINYINTESEIPKRNSILGSLIIMIILCIPSDFFGIKANLSKLIILPLVLVFSIWIFYLLINTENKKNQYVLFLGVFSIFISLMYLFTAYKIASAVMYVPLAYILIIVFTYMIFNVLSVLNVLRLIKKGYYGAQKKIENPMGVIFAMSILGLGIGRSLVGKMSENTAVTILITCLLFMGFLHAMGVHNVIKYYFIKQLQEETNKGLI